MEFISPKTFTHNRWLNSITNVGCSDCEGQGRQVQHRDSYFDYHDDLYGREIESLLLQKLRGEKRFESVDALKRQAWKTLKGLQTTGKCSNKDLVTTSTSLMKMRGFGNTPKGEYDHEITHFLSNIFFDPVAVSCFQDVLNSGGNG